MGRQGLELADSSEEQKGIPLTSESSSFHSCQKSCCPILFSPFLSAHDMMDKQSNANKSLKHACNNNYEVFSSRKETGRARVTLTLTLVFKSYWVGNKASLTGRVASGSCPPLALLGHCSCQVHLAQPFPQCALGLSRLSSAVRRLLVVQLPLCSRKTLNSFDSPTAFGEHHINVFCPAPPLQAPSFAAQDCKDCKLPPELCFWASVKRHGQPNPLYITVITNPAV